MAAEPQNLKKIKLDIAPIFNDFIKNETAMKKLIYVITALKEGYARMSFILIKINEANARTSASFTHATCDTAAYKNEIYVAGSVFQEGVVVLEQFVRTEQKKLPADDIQRKALEKLLLFLSEDHDGLFPKDSEGKEIVFNGREGEWAVIVAEHLLTKLAVDKDYVLTNGYPSLPPDSLKGFSGNHGDTTFGCEEGWHGSVDILMENNLPVQLLKDPQDPQDDLTEGSVSSIEIKSEKNFVDQLLAQTIVFSFLQMKYNKLKLTHSLIPTIGISTQHLYINMYDCINDVFLKSDALEMFGDDKVLDHIVVLLWLTLNYRYFCTGIAEEMKDCKADFHERLGDMITVYSDKVQRPMKVSGANKQHEPKNWSLQQAKQVKKILKKTEWVDFKPTP